MSPRPAWLLLLVLLSGAAAGAQPVVSDTARKAPAAPPPFQTLRYEEDYTRLRNPANRTDALDGLKFIGLNVPRTAWLTLGGQAQLWAQHYTNENWGLAPERSNGNFLQRYLLHADLHFGPAVRVFGQLQSSFQAGRKGGPGILDEDQLQLHQAFIDMKLPFADSATLTLRAGRQELYYGNGKLVEPRSGPNIRLSFDALRLIWQGKRGRADAFVSQPVINTPGVFDDSRNRNQTFWGLYIIRPLPKIITGGGLDVYYLDLKNEQAKYDKGVGMELRHTVGFRLFGRGKHLDFDTENFYQWGTFGNGTISARAITADVGYTLAQGKRSLRIGLGGSISTGDAGPGTTRLGTVNPLFPTGFYFGPPVTFLGPSNTMVLRPSLTLKPSLPVTVVLALNVLWRHRLTDGLYTPNAFLLLPSRGSSARYAGSQLSLTAIWQVQRHLSCMLLAGYFIPGDFIRESTPGLNVTFVAPIVSYTF